jgi:PEP-CTERM motif
MRRVLVFSLASLLTAAVPSFAGGILMPSLLTDDPPSICDSLGGNLVTNCGFETGDFAGWTHSGNTGSSAVTSGASYVNSGTYGAQLGPVGSDGLLTQVVTTSSGVLYNFGFYLHNDGGTPNDFSASWDGTPVFSLVNAPNSPYTPHIFSVLGTGSDTIQFAFRQDPNWWGLDDVGVIPANAPVPEPATLTMLGTALLGAGFRHRKRRERWHSPHSRSCPHRWPGFCRR